MTKKLNISKVSKLDGIRSWSLEAVKTCPGAQAGAGELVDACKGCYASGGFYNFPGVKKPRVENKEDWKRDDWETDMIDSMKRYKFFRWFDSGDIYTPKLAEKIKTVIEFTPHVKHWLPTRSHKIAKILPILEEIKKLSNVVVRYSSDNIDKFDNTHGSVIVSEKFAAPQNVEVCLAYENEGKCNGCRKCWDENIEIVGYVAHGRKMKKLLQVAA